MSDFVNLDRLFGCAGSLRASLRRSASPLVLPLLRWDEPGSCKAVHLPQGQTSTCSMRGRSYCTTTAHRATQQPSDVGRDGPLDAAYHSAPQRHHSVIFARSGARRPLSSRQCPHRCKHFYFYFYFYSYSYFTQWRAPPHHVSIPAGPAAPAMLPDSPPPAMLPPPPAPAVSPGCATPPAGDGGGACGSAKGGGGEAGGVPASNCTPPPARPGEEPKAGAAPPSSGPPAGDGGGVVRGALAAAAASACWPAAAACGRSDGTAAGGLSAGSTSTACPAPHRLARGCCLPRTGRCPCCLTGARTWSAIAAACGGKPAAVGSSPARISAAACQAAASQARGEEQVRLSRERGPHNVPTKRRAGQVAIFIAGQVAIKRSAGRTRCPLNAQHAT
jgi:hypothetical protein